MRRGVRWAETTCASKPIPNSSRASAAGSIIGQSESLPITMPTIGSLVLIRSVLLLEGERGLDDAVGQVPRGSGCPRPDLGEVVAERRDVAELAPRPLTLAVPVQLHV